MVPNNTRLKFVISDGFVDKVMPIEDKYLKKKKENGYVLHYRQTNMVI